MKPLKTCLALFSASLLFSGCAGPESNSAVRNPATQGPESRFALYGTNRVHYLAVGKGTRTLVFVHGWSCNANFWREQIPALQEKGRLLLVDLPGHGMSDKPVTEYSMDFLAGAVLAVMDHERLQQATLVGHSMGVAVICRAHAQAPGRVSGLVAVDGLLRRPKMTREQIEQFTRPYHSAQYEEQARLFIGSMFPNPGTEELRDRVLADMLATPQHVMSATMEGMFNLEQPAWDLQKLSIPLLCINTASPMWTEDYQSYVRSLSPKAHYRTISGTGHFLMLEKPAEFNAALAELLAATDLIHH